MCNALLLAPNEVAAKLGLPVPVLGAFSESLAGELYHNQYDALCLEKDLKKIGASASIAMLINMIVGLVHGLFYQESRDGQRKLYEVRTRKILTYSNYIASASNLLYVTISAAIGNETAFRKLDIGGFIVTLYRLITDTAFIQKVKEEFVFGNFRAQIQDGDGVYDLDHTSDTAGHPVRAALRTDVNAFLNGAMTGSALQTKYP